METSKREKKGRNVEGGSVLSWPVNRGVVGRRRGGGGTRQSREIRNVNGRKPGGNLFTSAPLRKNTENKVTGNKKKRGLSKNRLSSWTNDWVGGGEGRLPL